MSVVSFHTYIPPLSIYAQVRDGKTGTVFMLGRSGGLKEGGTYLLLLLKGGEWISWKETNVPDLI